MWTHVIDALPYIVVVMAFLMVRLVRVFTTHQQKMAEILNRTNSDHAEVSALRREIAELKALVHENVIAVDGRRQSSTPPPIDVAERLRGG